MQKGYLENINITDEVIAKLPIYANALLVQAKNHSFQGSMYIENETQPLLDKLIKFATILTIAHGKNVIELKYLNSAFCDFLEFQQYSLDFVNRFTAFESILTGINNQKEMDCFYLLYKYDCLDESTAIKRSEFEKYVGSTFKCSYEGKNNASYKRIKKWIEKGIIAETKKEQHSYVWLEKNMFDDKKNGSYHFVLDLYKEINQSYNDGNDLVLVAEQTVADFSMPINRREEYNKNMLLQNQAPVSDFHNGQQRFE
jgi:hypothetical protein